MFLLKKIVSALLLPPLFPLVLIALGLLVLRRHPRLGRALSWFGLLLALLLITPASVEMLLAGLERDPAVSPAQLHHARAIVVLGGGNRPNAPEYGGPTVNGISLQRVRYAAHLARETRLPVLVSGGAAIGKSSDAHAMRAVLTNEFGVPVRWIEDKSRDTHENAQFSAAMLRAAGIDTVALVTDAIHMPRAEAEFEAAGIHAIPAPTGYLRSAESDDGLISALPGPTAAWNGWYATHEWLGRFAAWASRQAASGSARAHDVLENGAQH